MDSIYKPVNWYLKIHKMIIKTKNLTKEYEAGSQIVKALNGIDLSV